VSATDDPRGPGPAVPPADELDELASALHDGEGTPAEAARAAEPDVAARMAAFARVSDAIGEPVPPVEDATRDRVIAAAVAAWGTSPPGLDDATDDRPAVDDLARRRQRRLALARPLGIAAAILAAIAVGGVALRSGDADDEQLADDAATETSAAADSEGGAGATQEQAALALGALVELGDFATVDQLAAAFDADLAGRTSDAEPAPMDDDADESAAYGDEGTEAGGDAVPVVPPAGSALPEACSAPDGTVEGPARATVAGRPVVAYVVDDGRQRRVVVLDEADCSLVGERPSSG
jgi:hypothetical protein